MSEITGTPLSPNTPIEDVIGSPRAIKALKAKGINKIGDIRSLPEIATLAGVSSGVLARLQEAGASSTKPATPVDEIEEGEHPVVLRSKHAGYILRLLGGDVVPAPVGIPGRPSIVQPVAIMFKNGEAELSRQTWVTMRHRRDQFKINEDMAHPAADRPWRAEAIGWLRSRTSHRRGDFVVLE